MYTVYREEDHPSIFEAGLSLEEAVRQLIHGAGQLHEFRRQGNAMTLRVTAISPTAVQALGKSEGFVALSYTSSDPDDATACDEIMQRIIETWGWGEYRACTDERYQHSLPVMLAAYDECDDDTRLAVEIRQSRKR